MPDNVQTYVGCPVFLEKSREALRRLGLTWHCDSRLPSLLFLSAPHKSGRVIPCAWQVWQLPGEEEEGHYITRDKQHGRRVRRHHIDAALAEFFCNGAYLRLDVLETVLRRVEALLEVMQEHEGHRFYSASLLVLYEGDPHRPCKADVRLIDFAHTCKARTHQCRGPDWGFIFGLVQLRSTLARLLEKPLLRDSAPSGSDPEADSTSESDTTDTSGSSSEAEDECEGEASSDE